MRFPALGSFGGLLISAFVFVASFGFAPPPSLAQVSSASEDDAWDSRFGTMGVNDWVVSLTVGGSSNVYAGGYFSAAGGVSANYIVKWNGVSWSALGTGMNDRVLSLAVDGNGNLYAGGMFTAAGGVSAKYIAKWDGANWSALGSGMNDAVFALAVDGSGHLYAGGRFTTAGGVSAKYIAKWDGTSWSALGLGVDSWVVALAADSRGDLYVGGYFINAGGVTANRIAKWDGASWSALGSGLIDGVRALALDGNGNLYAGGYFTAAGGVSAKYIAKWDGANWSALGSGMSYAVFALVVDGRGNLYAGGDFLMAGGTTVNKIAKWDGASWSALGSGMSGYDNSVEALCVDGSGDLYVGGLFTGAGGKPSNHFAIWHDLVVPVYLRQLTAVRSGWTVMVRCELGVALPVGQGDRLEVWRALPGQARVLLGHLPLTGSTSLIFTDPTPPVGQGDYWLREVDGAGNESWLGSTHLEAASIPTALVLSQNHPNPFNPRTTISYSLPKPGHVTLVICDLQGSRVATLVDANLPAGECSAEWSGLDDRGEPVPSGVYFARLQTSAGVRTVKVTLAK